jgi:hypothetical protein
MTSSIFIPRFEKYDYLSDENYKHFTYCEVRNSGRLFECKQCIGIIGTPLMSLFDDHKGAD